MYPANNYTATGYSAGYPPSSYQTPYTTGPYASYPQYPAGMPGSSPAPPSYASSPQTTMIVDSRYCLPHETVLVLRERMFNVTDDFYVSDVTGRNHFSIQGRMFSMKNKHTLFDINGQAVVSMHSDVIAIPRCWYITRGSQITSGAAMYKLRPKVLTMTPKVDIFAHAQGGDFAHTPSFRIRGDFFDRNFQITKMLPSGQEQLLAQVTKQWQMGYMPETYYLRVMPGVDLAGITSFCMITEEMYCEERD